MAGVRYQDYTTEMSGLSFETPSMLFSISITLLTVLQRSGAFRAGAPAGTGLEWLTIASVLVPAVLLVVLVYLGSQRTV